MTLKNEICIVCYNNIHVSPLTVSCPKCLSCGILSEGHGNIVTGMSNIVWFIIVGQQRIYCPPIGHWLDNSAFRERLCPHDKGVCVNSSRNFTVFC